MRGQSLFDKNYLNVLRGKNSKKRGKPSIKSGNKRAEIPQQKTKAWQNKERTADVAGAGTQQDNKISGDLRQKTRAGIRQDKKTAGDQGQKIGASKQWDDKIVKDLGWETRVVIKAGIEVGIERGNKKEEDLGQEDKKDPTKA